MDLSVAFWIVDCALNIKDLYLNQDLIKLTLQSQNLLSFETLNSQGYCQSLILI